MRKLLLFLLLPLGAIAQVVNIPNTTFPATRTLINSNFNWLSNHSIDPSGSYNDPVWLTGLAFSKLNRVDPATGITWESSMPFTNHASWDFQTGAAFIGYNTATKHLNGGRSSVVVPTGAGYAGAVGIAWSFYAASMNVGGVAFGLYTSAQARASGQLLWGAQPNATDCNHKNPSDPGVTCFSSPIVIAIESDRGIGNPGSGSLLSAGYNAGFVQGTLYQPANSYWGFGTKSSSHLPNTVSFNGTGTNDIQFTVAANYTGNWPYLEALQIQTKNTTPTPDTYKYSPFLAGCTLTGCWTGLDLVVQGTTTQVCPASASHIFTNGDVGGTTRLEVISGTGGTPGYTTINSFDVNTNCATLSGSAGTAASTLKYAVWSNTAVPLALSNELILPVDSTTSATLAGQPIRRIPTSYGAYVAAGVLFGHDVAANWSWQTSAVPSDHWMMGASPGYSDRGIQKQPLNSGSNQPSVTDEWEIIDNQGNGRVANVGAVNGTKGVTWDVESECGNGGAQCGFSVTRNNNGTKTKMFVVDGVSGNVSVLGSLYSTVILPFSVSATGIVLSAAAGGVCTPSCMVNAIFTRNSQNATITDHMDTTANALAWINLNRTDQALGTTGFTLAYRNLSATQAIALDVPTSNSGANGVMTFSPAGPWNIPAGFTAQISCSFTSLVTPALTCDLVQTATTKQ